MSSEGLSCRALSNAARVRALTLIGASSGVASAPHPGAVVGPARTFPAEAVDALFVVVAGVRTGGSRAVILASKVVVTASIFVSNAAILPPTLV